MSKDFKSRKRRKSHSKSPLTAATPKVLEKRTFPEKKETETSVSETGGVKMGREKGNRGVCPGLVSNRSAADLFDLALFLLLLLLFAV